MCAACLELDRNFDHELDRSDHCTRGCARADDKAAHDRLLAKAHAFCSKVASQFPATMRNAPPVPTTVPLPTPLEAVLDPTAVSPAGQKAFAVTLALAPPLVPGAKVTALVPPSKQRIAFVVPESVTALLKFCVLVPASVELDRFALAEVRMEAPVVAPSMSSAGVPSAPSATTSSAGVPAAPSVGPSAPSAATSAASAPPPTVPPLPPPPPTVPTKAAAEEEASRAVATALAAVSSSSVSSAALPPAALPPAALPTPAESTVAIAPVPPPMMPAFALPPRPVKPTPIPLPGAFEAMPQTNGKAPVGKVRVLVPLLWDDALMYGGAKLSVFVPRLAKSVLATLPPQRPTGGAVDSRSATG